MLSQKAFPTVILLVVVLASCVQVHRGWLLSRLRTRCYDNPPIGCFPTSYPFNNAGRLPPQSPSAINVRFHFRTPEERRRIITLANARQILTGRYDPSSKTAVVIHGYMEQISRPWIREMEAELLRKEHINVVVVDWSAGADSLVYFQSAANTRVVGAIVALFLQELISLGGNPSTFHLIGFSLGAHVAGETGNRLRGIGRITGLDPAGLSFENRHPEARLDPSDANFVDVIHTDIRPTLGMGTEQPMGTIDFYPNDGMNQPGCASNVIELVTSLISSLEFSSTSVACSHLRAPRLFSSTINNNCTFVTRHCPRQHTYAGQVCNVCHGGAMCPVMGYNLDPGSVRQRSRVYFPTTGQWPFCHTA